MSWMTTSIPTIKGYKDGENFQSEADGLPAKFQ